MRVLAVDHGEKKIGLALSDPTGTIANPLSVLPHVSRDDDADRVLALVEEHAVDLIVVGQSYLDTGEPNLAGHRAAHFAEALRSKCKVPVGFWDESFSTQEARAARIRMGASKKQRGGHLDALAATIILQSYLDAQET